MANPTQNVVPVIQRKPTVQYVEDFFIYSAKTSALAAAASDNQTIQIQADSDFKLIKIGQFSDIAAAAQTESTRVVPLMTIQITDTGSGRQLFDNPIDIGAWCGQGELPFILPVPRIFKSRTVINIAFANFSAATAYTTQLAFIGTKIFYLPQQG